MARLRPQSRSLFAKIPGVGYLKLEEYFAPFTREIKAYCEKHNLEMEVGEPIDVVQLVSREKYDVIAEALQRVGTEALRPVKDDLGEAYSFEEIKLVRAAMQRHRQS